MKNYMQGVVIVLFFVACSHKYQMNIGDISLNKFSNSALKNQEYYDNKRYPVNQYCNDQRSYLANDKFSTENYLTVTNRGTKQSRVGKYPIWFLLNDDALNILSVTLLQKNEGTTKLSLQELGILINSISFLLTRTARFLFKINNIIKDFKTEKYEYTAFSINKKNQRDVVFYKFNSTNYLKISKMFIDVNNRFIRLNKGQSCSEKIRRLF